MTALAPVSAVFDSVAVYLLVLEGVENDLKVSHELFVPLSINTAL